MRLFAPPLGILERKQCGDETGRVQVLSQAISGALLILTPFASVNGSFGIGDVVVAKDHVNGTGRNPLFGPNHPEWGSRFNDMSDLFSASLRSAITSSAAVSIALSLFPEGVPDGPTACRQRVSDMGSNRWRKKEVCVRGERERRRERRKRGENCAVGVGLIDGGGVALQEKEVGLKEALYFYAVGPLSNSMLEARIAEEQDCNAITTSCLPEAIVACHMQRKGDEEVHGSILCPVYEQGLHVGALGAICSNVGSPSALPSSDLEGAMERVAQLAVATLRTL